MDDRRPTTDDGRPITDRRWTTAVRVARPAPLRHSGVAWLGEVPGHWGVVRLKRCFNIVGGSTPQSDVEEYWNGE
ncbi:MAG: hypothetical protein NTZ50_14335, partial [Chloroflexi bacterium]|nr:hypothetical protein [Chloroflexota bacterium]